MTTIFQYVMANWVEWLFVAISTFLAYSYKQLSRRQKEEMEKNRAIQNGLQALLRDRIVESYHKYQDSGRCPIEAKENVKRMYDAYHTLGGNDIATGLKDALLDMPDH